MTTSTTEIELLGTVTIRAKHLPSGAFAGTGRLAEVAAVFNYVPRGEEIGGAWDEVLGTGGYFNDIWLVAPGVEEGDFCLLPYLTIQEIAHLEVWAEEEYTCTLH